MKSSEMFIDEVTISVLAGDGGDGCVHLHREKYVPRGGPDGGDGGRGGDVVLVADRNLATLLEQRMRRENRAESGEPGGANGCNGRGGADARDHGAGRHRSSSTSAATASGCSPT